MTDSDLNIERLRELYETGLDVEEDLIGFLINDYKNMLATAPLKFKENILSRDKRSMEILAHSLKSNSANLGLNQQRAYFLHLEELSKAGNFDEFSERLSELEKIQTRAHILIETIQLQNYGILKKAA